MAGVVPGDLSHHGIVETSHYIRDRMEENDGIGGNWYLSRKDIEENSPSRRDGIELKKEAYLRKSYCTFLQDLGMRLKVPQVTIATAMVFCHRFFLRQSHGKNDRRTVATVCMFLAGKVEETPRPLKDVILVSYEIIHKKDPAAIQRIKQREVYEQQKELILLGERVVLTTLGFDLNVHHPYKPLVEAIKKFKVAQNALAQVAWNFVNDGLRTSLCLQFKPQHIAAGAIFLAAKFLKVKLPSDGDKVWWQEFDVTPRQLEEVSNQMLELYEQTRAVAPPSHGNEADGSSANSVATHRAPPKAEPSPSRNRPNKNTQNDNNSKDSSSTKAKEGLNEQQHAREEPSQTETATISQAKEKSLHSSPSDAIRKIDKSKVKAALEKRRKEKGEVARKAAVIDDDDDLIERELESGIELAAEGERTKRKEANSVAENAVEEEGEFRSPRENRTEKYDDIQFNRSISAKRRDCGMDDADGLGQIERDGNDHKRQRLENHAIDA